jgi:hypothetical protein
VVKSHTFKVRRAFNLLSGKRMEKGTTFVAKSIPYVRAGFELFKLEFEDA